MPKVAPIQTNFNAGEFSPLMAGRIDFASYQNALELCNNFIPMVQGGITRRPGTYFTATTKNNAAARLIRFEFSVTQAYILEFGDGYIRFYRNEDQIDVSGVPAYSGATAYVIGDLVVQTGVNYYCIAATTGNAPPNATYWYPLTGTIYEIPSPYTAAGDLSKIKITQSADVLYIAHPNCAPRTLSRTGHTAWKFSDYTSEWGPFLEENPTETSLILASAVTGSGITLTASGTGNAPFNANHVGAIWQFRDLLASNYDKWETAKVIAGASYRHYEGRLYYTTAGGTSGTRPLIHDTGTASDGGITDWAFIREDTGYAKITGYTSTTVVTATVIKRLPDSAIVGSGIFRWTEGAWSAARGYPVAVIFYEDRLWWAGTTHQPQTLWTTKSSQYTNFKSIEPDGTIADDNAITITLNANDVNAIRWLSEDERALLIGTAGGEWILRAGGVDAAITPTNLHARRSTTTGSADIQPVRAGNAALYIQKSGLRLRELAYIYDIDGFRSPDLTEVAEHITQSGIKEISYQREPHSIVWLVRNDGLLVAITYSREQKVIGWHRHQIGGVFGTGNAVVESIATIPSPDGTRDQTWLIVKRTINAGTKRHIEFMEQTWVSTIAQEDAIFGIDSVLTYDGAPTATLTGLNHLEGQTVSLLADGAVRPNEVVTAGAITMESTASVVQVGLAYTSDATTLRIEAGAANGTAQGKMKRIHSVAFRFFETLGVKIGKSFTTMSRIIFRTAADYTNEAVPLYTGDKVMSLESGWDTNGQICITVDQPFPCTLLAIMPQLETNDDGHGK